MKHKLGANPSQIPIYLIQFNLLPNA